MWAFAFAILLETLTLPRDEIDSLMGKYVGQEHTMYLKICKKYKVQPEPEIKADAGHFVASFDCR